MGLETLFLPCRSDSECGLHWFWMQHIDLCLALKLRNQKVGVRDWNLDAKCIEQTKPFSNSASQILLLWSHRWYFNPFTWHPIVLWVPEPSWISLSVGCTPILQELISSWHVRILQLVLLLLLLKLHQYLRSVYYIFRKTRRHDIEETQIQMLVESSDTEFILL